MTEIAFHFNAPDPVAYACRLLRKAVGAGAKVVVTAPTETLQRLDTALWAFAATEFVPHAMVGADPAVLEHSPVYLTQDATDSPYQQVLVNLADSTPAGFERYERLIEVVGPSQQERSQARQRWKQYLSRGYPLQGHDLAAKEQS